MSEFDNILKQLKDEYMPLIKEAQNHLYEMQDALQRRKHTVAIEYGYSNDVIDIIQRGFDVIKTGYADGSWWIEIGGATYCDYDDPVQLPMLEAFDMAEDLGLIEVDDSRGDITHQHYRLTTKPPS